MQSRVHVVFGDGFSRQPAQLLLLQFRVEAPQLLLAQLLQPLFVYVYYQHVFHVHASLLQQQRLLQVLRETLDYRVFFRFRQLLQLTHYVLYLPLVD